MRRLFFLNLFLFRAESGNSMKLNIRRHIAPSLLPLFAFIVWAEINLFTLFTFNLCINYSIFNDAFSYSDNTVPNRNFRTRL